MNSDADLRAIFSIKVSKDQLHAYVYVREINEAVQFTLKDIEALLAEHRIVHGIQYQELTEVAKNPLLYVNQRIQIAQGTFPTKGNDGYLEFPYLNKAGEHDVQDQGGNIDLKNVQTLDNVKKGELIAVRHAAGLGQVGKTVTGQTIPPLRGKEVVIKPGKNVVLNQERTKLYATIDGMVTRTQQNLIHVHPIFEVSGDVDYKVGNIDFPGTVIVRGSVLPGFSIKASGDIRIFGTIEGAYLEASGSIETKEGIVGQNKGKVKAGLTVKSSFVTDAWIEAGQDVLVTQSIMHSTVKAGQSVICQGGNGLIVGGSIQAGERVIARTIGNPASTYTSIEVGMMPDLRDELQSMKKRQLELQEHSKKTEQAIRLLEQLQTAGQLTPDQAAMLHNLKHTRIHTSEELQELMSRQIEMEEWLKNTSHIEIIIEKMIYPGTKLTLIRQVKEISDVLKRVRFSIVNSEITIGSF